MPKILVTGALGNVGGYLVEEGLKRGFSIRAADINPEKIGLRFGSQVESVYFDFTKPETFERALSDVDFIFLMRPPHLGKPEDLAPFIQSVAAQKSLQLLCFLSLQGIEKNPVPPHYKIERMIEAANINYCHIRPSFFMQNLSGVHAFEIKHFSQIYVPVGKAKTSFIDANDIAETIVTIFNNPEKHCGKAYTLTGSVALNYKEVSRLLSRELGREIEYNRPSLLSAYLYWRNIRKLDKSYAQVMIMLYIMTRLGVAATSNSEVEALLGRKPTNFETFIKKNISIWQ